jgi:hypothetical protein
VNKGFFKTIDLIRCQQYLMLKPIEIPVFLLLQSNFLQHLTEFVLDETVLRMVWRPRDDGKVARTNPFCHTHCQSGGTVLGANPIGRWMNERRLSLPLHETSPAAAPDTKQDSRRYRRSGGGGGGTRRGCSSRREKPSSARSFCLRIGGIIRRPRRQAWMRCGGGGGR